ncbi:hypothetical protein PTI98_003174 [Pleurotus ostreatus]|nr:hypothetical protein PTI98_003174 [Pleurotus ostreatus]
MADFTSDSLEIPWTDLRQSCIDHYDDLLKATRDHLSEKTYEELDVFLTMLFIQKQILDNGVAMGSIVVRQRGKLVAQQDAPILDSFELHQVIAWCEDLISSRNGDISPGMDEYLADNGVHPTQFLITCEWTSLLYIASVIKGPRATHKAVPSDTLNVPILSDSSSDDDSTHPNEVVTLSQLRDILGYDFHLFSDYAAKHVLSLLHHLGFFYESRLHPDIFSGDPQETYCIFPLPLGLDLSTNVELLFSSIEASLSDLDLSVNEFGFLILTRKLWPDGLLSDYAHRRLCKSVLCWILAEDVSLAAILRDFLAKQKPLPGIRSAMDSHPWPYTQDSRPSPSGSANNGGDYIAARRGMLSRYACRWLRAFHDQNPPQYAVLLFGLAQEIAEIGDIPADSSNTGKRVTYDRTLSNIAGFMRASVTFTVGDDLFLFWLESLLPDCVYTEPMPSLLRLLPKEVDSFQRTSVFLDAHPQQDASTTSIEPWRVVTKTAQENVEGLQRGLKWLHVLVRSGIDIPAPTFEQICDYALNYGTPFEDIHFFIETIFTSLWLRSLGRQSLQRTIARLWSKHASTVWDNLKSATQLETTMRFIRYSLAANLILYGCERQNIITLGFISQAEVADIPSRRKITTRAEEISDPITIDPEIMEVLDAYITTDIDELSSYIIKFLHAFLAESPLLESYEVDNFVLRNGQVLCRWAWKAYDIQQFDISAIRPAFLLRTLVVDEEPFQALLDGLYQSSVDWKIRLDSVSRIFRIILETLSASFNVEGRQWRSSVANVFRKFFSAIWSDEKEEVRLEAKSLSRTLLPTHLLAVALCWNEALMKAPMSERVGITSFLIELHSHFPEWQLLSWEVITEILSELNYTEKHGDAEDGPASAHLSMYGIHSEKDDAGSVVGLDDEMSQLRRGVLLLSLRMVSDGILVDNQTLMKVKLHLLQALGFDGVSTVTTADGHNFDVRFNEVRVMDAHMYPLVTELVAVLDSHHKFWQASIVNAPQNGSSYGLVGAVFSDVLIRIFSTLDDLTSIPVMVLKGLVEGLGIIIHKQDFEERPMRHLQQPLRKAMHRLHEVLLGEGSYEVRQLALSVTQAFIKKCPTFMGTIIISSVETATKLVSSQGHHGMNDLLVAQARSFLETTLTAYPNGLFISICKHEVDDELFVVIKQLTDAHAKPSTRHLREVLLRDTLMKAIESDRESFQHVLFNLQSYVDVVHHENYTAELMQFVGQCLTHLARRASEWAAESLDTSPLIIIPAKLMQFNKVHSREMFNYTETMLRIILNRLDVKSSSLSQLIRVAATIVKKPYQPNTHSTQTPPNSIVQVVFEILGDGLRLKSRVQPTTIASMLEVITTSEHGIDSLAKTHPLSFLGLVDSGFHFLSHHTWTNERADKDFDASISVAKMVLEAATLDKNIMVRLFEHVTEKRTSLSVRGWNIMVLAAMTEVTGTWEDILFTQLGAFTIAHQTTILGLINAGGPLSQNAKTEVNYAYISMKAWLLLAHKVSLRREVDGATWLAIWSGLWTPFESLVDVIEAENTPGVSTTLSLVTWGLIADLLFFINSLRCPLSSSTSSMVALLERVRNSTQASSSTKIIKALKSASEPPPEPSLEVLVSQAGKDIIAEEKIKVLWERENSDRRGNPDRHRREHRAVS